MRADDYAPSGASRLANPRLGVGMSERRNALRLGRKRERAARASGSWGVWRRTEFPKGSVGQTGFCYGIDHNFANDLYSVLVRHLDAGPEGRVHLAIRTISHHEPPWRDLQRIKNELLGPERIAFQVCPPDSRLIDQADMYHLWVMAEGFELGFGLHPLDETA